MRRGFQVTSINVLPLEVGCEENKGNDNHFLPKLVDGLCGLNSIGAQIAGVFLGCARVHSACGAPQVVKSLTC